MKNTGLKSSKTELGKVIGTTLPMAEELAKGKFTPICLIGIKEKNKDGVLHTHFATITDDPEFEVSFYNMLRAMVVYLEETRPGLKERRTDLKATDHKK